MKLLFLPQNIQCETVGTATVLEAARAAGVEIPADCGGAGVCGMCRVRTVAGEFSKPDTDEIETLGTEQTADGWRLSCRLKPLGDCAVELPLGKEKITKGNVKFPRDFAAKNGNDGWAVAFDIGTTTVAGMLCNRKNGTVTAVSSKANPQGAYGADVISRIEYCIKNVSGLATLSELIRNCLDEITGELCEKQGIGRSDIMSALAVGNSTMTHIFFGVDPSPLSRLPFSPVFLGHEPVKACDVGIHIAADAMFEILPNIAGHVGADITGALLASRLTDSSAPAMMIDIGTNGEMGVYKDGKLLVCSTAAGPAFEGACITCGTRAIEGAVSEAQMIDGEFVIKTIGDAVPIGICGSGLIDLMAVLVEEGVIDKTGRIRTAEKAEALGVPAALTNRIKTEEKGASFTIFEDETRRIALYQKDVREVQLAKAAISAGMKILMKELDMTESDLSAVMLAGAFGNHIRRKSALKLGILPRVDIDRVLQLGNAAGSGAAMAAMNEEEKTKGTAIARMAVHVELGSNPNFQNQFVSEMRL